nr:DNA methyltransferase [Kallipyga gabonensis]
MTYAPALNCIKYSVGIDPAAGSGNFLTETYISLRKLENEILKELLGSQIVMGKTHNPIKVSISQFYGIEINDFAVSVARTALWIAESQMMKETEDIVNVNLNFLPLKTYSNILEANALRIDWESVISKYELDYIMGNPPFSGARLMSADQKKDMNLIFGKMRGVGNLDYVSAWYKKSCDFIDKTNIECAFVSTNSIAQGEQVSILWEPLSEEHNIYINFAHQSFVWDSEATTKAHVHCVIIGFSQIERKEKHLYSSDSMLKKSENINSYLLQGPNVFISSRKNPISNVPKMVFGSMPNDGGNLLLDKSERDELIKDYPNSINLIKLFMGSREFINKIDRYCLWMNSTDAMKGIRIKPIKDRIESVRDYRLSSKRKATQKLAEIPYSFGEVRQPNGDYLLLPRVSSERRKYIPIGFLPGDVVASDAALIIPEATIYEFGVLTSNVHNGWMRAVAGRLKSDYRYSKDIVYNNFPWPNSNEKQKERIEKTANKILEARNLYPKSSYADLYNELTMPPELRKAHQENDKAVMEAYGFDWRNMTESECVAELMKLYQEAINENE